MGPDSVSRRTVLAMGPALLGSQELTPVKRGPASDATVVATRPDELPPDNLPLIDRAFLRVREGLVHFRSAGSTRDGRLPPLYLAHAGPGSSRAFEGLLPSLGRTRFTFAPDMLGNGDSAPPARESVDMGYYVDCALRVMDALKLERVDFYGSHTGAQIGCQLAVTSPQRVRRLVLDGLPLFPEEFRARLLAHYAPAVKPDEFGGHLAWAWNFVRDQSLFWPYFDRQPANRLVNGVASADLLHLGVTDVIKALSTYHIAYRAAFVQDLRPLLPQLRCPVLLMASERDPLSSYFSEVSALLPKAVKLLLPRTAGAADRLAAVESFLSS